MREIADRGHCGHTLKEDVVSWGLLSVASGRDGRDVMVDALNCEDAAFTPDFPATVAFSAVTTPIPCRLFAWRCS